MSTQPKKGAVHKALCDGFIEENVVFPILRDGDSQFYIQCPCCAFWRGAIFGAVSVGTVLAILAGAVAWTH